MLPLWNDEIAPRLRAGRNVLVAAHGNSIRAIVKMLDNVPESEIVELNIPTGVPLLYEFDAGLRPTGHRYLGDPAAIAAARRRREEADREALTLPQRQLEREPGTAARGAVHVQLSAHFRQAGRDAPQAEAAPRVGEMVGMPGEAAPLVPHPRPAAGSCRR